MGTTKKTDIKALLIEFARIHDEQTQKVITLREAQAKAEQAERERYEVEKKLQDRIVELLKKEKGHWGSLFNFYRLPDGRVCEVKDNNIFIMKMTDLS